MNEFDNTAPENTATIRPEHRILHIGRVSRLPQYWAESTTSPSPMPLVIICSRNWIWLARATPLSASSEYRPSITLSASDTLYTTRFCTAMNSSSEKNCL